MRLSDADAVIDDTQPELSILYGNFNADASCSGVLEYIRHRLAGDAEELLRLLARKEPAGISLSVILDAPVRARQGVYRELAQEPGQALVQVLHSSSSGRKSKM